MSKVMDLAVALTEDNPPQIEVGGDRTSPIAGGGRYVIEADEVARAVVDAVERGKIEVTVPWFPYRIASVGQVLVPGLFSRFVTRRAGQHRDE